MNRPSWIRKLIHRPVRSPIRKMPRIRLAFEKLEDRWVPATFTVLNSNDTGAGSLRQAVADANATSGADTIVFGDGSASGGTNFLDSTPDTILLTSGAITFAGDTNLTTVIGPGANLLSVSGGDTQQVFWINAGISTAISGMTVTDGKSGSEGGGVNNFGTLAMADCTISGSTAGTMGGGLNNDDTGVATLTNCTITGNTVTGSSGGGGGIQNTGSLTLNGCTITGNAVTGSTSSSGGISSQGGPAILIAVDTTFSGNTATHFGGGMSLNGTATLTNCTISGNTATVGGGGINSYTAGTTMINCTVSGNQTGGSGQGGGIFLNFGSLNVRNLTISGNTAATGGGIYHTANGTLTIRNSIVSANTATTETDVGGSINTDNGYNLFGAALSGTTFGTGNVYTSSPLLSALGNYGGPTQTMIPQAGSPAVGAGDNTGGPSTDQRGSPRVTGSGATIGAVEATAFAVTNTNNSGAGSLRQAVLDSNSAPTADVILFSSFFSSARTITLTSGQLTFSDAATTTLIGPGSALLTVSGNNASSVFTVDAGKSAAISGVRVTAATGGGVNVAGELLMSDSTITGNAGVGFNIVDFSAGNATLTNVVVSSNAGIGVNNRGVGGQLTLIDCTITGNATGIATERYPTTSIANTTISGNSGIGINAFGNGSLMVANSTISDNAGGGVFGIINATFTNTTISGNTAANGAGIRWNLRTISLLNSTVSGNTATTQGGGLLIAGGVTASVANTIVAGNSAPAAPDAGGAIVSGGTNLIGKTDGSSGWIGSDLSGTIASPLDARLGTLAANSGTTQTLAPLGTSPALNAGNPAIVASEAQILTILGASGSFTLTFAGQSTTAIAFDATAGTVQTALNGLSTIGGAGGSVAVTKTGNAFTITFGGSLAQQNVALVTGIGTGGASVATSTLVDGGSDQRGRGRFASTDIGAYEHQFKVTTTANNGPGSLRQAMINANGESGTNSIVFRIGSGAKTITPSKALPVITGSVIIDGTTQPGFSGSPLIEVSGVSAGGAANGITITGSGSTIRGLVINRFGEAGVLIDGTSATGNTITGNYIGTDITGTIDLGNARDGINIRAGAKNNVIGGLTPGAGNLISGNDEHGITLRASGTTGNVVVGNLIGVNRDGTAALGNTQSGMTINVGASGNTIGGTTPEARNVISGNLGLGIHIIAASTSNNKILGNYIGTNSGNAALGNVSHGILIDGNVSGNTIGGTIAGAGNVIAFNGQNGLRLPDSSAANNTFRQNTFFANTGLAIDVGDVGVTLNTAGNDLNSPVFTSVRTGVGVIEVEGFARPGKTIEFYVSDSTGQGQVYLATGVEGSPADTDATSGSYGPGPVSGNVVGSDTANRFHFTIPVPADFAVGSKVTAVSIGSISEFGAPLAADVARAFGAPVVDAGPDAVLLVGQTLSGRGSFSDIDSDFWPTAEVNYGDGSGWQALQLDPPVYAPQSPEDFTIAATVGFAFNHRYSNPGNYTVSVRITDDSGETGGDALLVNVENAPPIIDNSRFEVTPQRLAEGGTVTLSGAFSDASASDTHTVQIFWGDGTQSDATVDETNRTFTAEHVYRDDNVLNTASDVYPLRVIITDGAGASATTVSGLFFVQVDNVRPSNLTLTTSTATLNEGGTLVLGGSFTDPGVLDTHRIAITWGDGSADTIVNLAAGVTTFAGITHQYRNGTHPATDYTISVRVADDDEPLSPVTAAAAVSVQNVRPTNVVVTPSVSSVFENDAITLTGSFTDPGTLDGHTVVINWGDGSGNSILHLAPGVSSFAGISHRYLDNPAGQPAGSFPITVTVADLDEPAGLATGTSAVTVRNADPSVSFSLSSTSILENGTVVVTGSYVDPGTLDRHTITINWGDGSSAAVSVDSTTRTFTASHRYVDDNPSGTSSDDYTITATVADNDGAIGIATRTLTVNNVAPSVRILPGTGNSVTSVVLASEVIDPSPTDTFTYAWSVIPVGGGTTVSGSGPSFTFASAASTSYTVTLTVTDDDGGTTATSLQVDVLTEFDDTYTPTTAPSGVSALMILGLGGNDEIDGSALAIPLILDGGADVDWLTGGSADDIIILHQGNDNGFGRGGNDRYRLTPNSTLTVEDGSGNNTLDFGTADFGITFDLRLTGGDVQDVKAYDPGLHFVSVNDLGTGQFGTLVGSAFGDSLTAASGSTLFGDAGADKFYINANTVNVQLSGGADADQLTLTGGGITQIDFRGDDGADTLTNTGSVGIITVTGGSDGDLLQLNTGSTATVIDFKGDDGADTLTNAGSVGTITFTGGSDGDLLQNTGTIATSIDFRGDDGADTLLNSGSIATIVFTGGSDGDLLQNDGTVATNIDFRGDDGADTLTNIGSVGTIIFTGGSDGDLLQTAAGSVATTVDFRGDDGADTLTNIGSVGTIVFTGGSDGDLLQTAAGSAATTIDFRGDDGADRLLSAGTVANIIFTGGSDGDLLQNSGTVATILDFRGDDGADTLTNLGTVATITFSGGSDGDLLQTSTGSVVTTIDFRGDEGADTLLNLGSATTIIFTGGSDGDLLQNNGTVATVLDFRGDDGVDTLTNFGTVATITFTGGSDGDLLQTATGSVATTIDFRGDDGADTLLNLGSATTITFTGGSDGDLLQNNGTVATVLDFRGDDGADTLTNLGTVATITFTGGSDGDLLQTSSGSVATTIDFRGDDGADTLTNLGTVTTIIFTGGADNDRLRNFADDADILSFKGDDGADLLVNTGSNVAAIDFRGDDGADILLNTGGSVATIDFRGDDGADILQNTGNNVATIMFTGGSDGDQLLNNGTSVTQISFQGDDGADILTNFGTVATITFTGGSDGDLLQTATGSTATTISFQGDDGADTLTTFGTATTIVFTGGSDGDLLQNAGTVATLIDFRGDDGADALTNIGAVATITFTGGSDGDLLQNAGTATTIDFSGDDGADTLTNLGTVATITFTGGSDGDLLQTATGSTATTIDFRGDDGADTLTNFGKATTIIFTGGSDGDLLQTATGSTATTISFQGDDGADTLLNFGASTNITFTGGSDGDYLQNSGAVATLIDFRGDDGADTLVNLSPSVAAITFTGGSDGDTFWNFGSASKVVFEGDDGADSLTNAGSVATIIFGGGSDGDLLQNTGTVATLIDFRGDDGADTLLNSGAATTITFTGGSDGDLLQTSVGSTATTIDFHGDDGADNLLNNGTAVTITFTGGSDGDLLQNSGAVATLIDFRGDDGADTLINTGTGTSIVFTAGADDDLYIERGEVDQLAFHGGAGNDRVLYSGSGTATLDGGTGSDEYVFVGAAQGAVTIPEAASLDIDVFDFSGYTASGVTIDLSRTTAQTLASGLTLTLSSSMGMENIVGTSFVDTLIGNARNNVMTGAAISDDRVESGQEWDGVTQWVYLDFDTETEGLEHVYTAAERDTIESAIAADFQGPDPQNPWFHVRVTQDRNDIPVALRDSAQYTTLYFNRTPSFNRPGGEASELDFRNVNLGGTASIQVNGLTGGANQPEGTSENIVALSAKIGAHELAHLMGIRHADAFGPIGYGLHSPPGVGSFKPEFGGPVGAFETFSHLIGSPATVGSDRFNDLNDLYFGEREAVKLSFAERGAVAAEQTDAHGSIASAQSLNLAALTVPTTSRGLNEGSTFKVAALAVTGQIGLVGGRSESDYYSFTGRKGDMFSIEVLSIGLATPGGTIDSVLRLYNASGQLVPYYGGVAENDDQFEPTDSLLYDVILPADGTYYIEVDTFHRDSNDPIFDPENPTSPLNPANTVSIYNPISPNFNPARLASFLDTRDDTDTGRYELFLYRIGASNTVDAGDEIHGGDGDDTLLGGLGGDTLVGGAGDDVIGLDGIATALTLPAQQSPNEGSTIVLLETDETQAIAWQISDGAGHVVDSGSGTSVSFAPTDNGSFTLNYTITGSGGDSTTDTMLVNVQNVAPTAALGNGGAVSEGSAGSVSFTAQSDTAADLSTLRYSYDFNNDGTFEVGDGAYAGSVTSASATVPAGYLAAGPGTRIVRGRIIDKDGGYTDYTTAITINNVAPSVAVGGIEGLSTPTLTRVGSFSDPGADTWTATVDYGDGTGTQSLSLNADKTYTLSHTYAESGIFTVTVTVSDGTATSSGSFDVIFDVPPTIDAGSDQTADEGAIVSLVGATFNNAYISATHTATIDWGDGTAVVAGGVSQSGSGDGVTGTITGSHRYADNGSYTVTVTVITPYGATSSDTFDVTVNNVEPTLAAISGPTLMIPGQPVTFSSAFTDPGFDNSRNAGGEVVESFSGTISWGDGSATESVTVTWSTGSPGVLSTGSAGKAHTYAANGNYTITLTLHDDDSGSATRTLSVTVADSAYILASSGGDVLSVSGNGRVVLPGVIEVNSSSSTAIRANGNAQISASQIHVVGNYSLSGNATISSTPVVGGSAAIDPLASLAVPNVPGTAGAVNLSGSSSLTISPGRFTQIRVSGSARLTMLPGIYVILGGGMSVTGNASVTGQGVTIYNAGSNYPGAGGSFGGIALTGNGAIDLTPPAVGSPYAGVLIFQSRDNPRALAISGNGLLGLRGTIYAPAAQLALSGNAELKASMVVKSMTVSGNASSTLMSGGDLGVADLAKTLLGADLWIFVDNSDNAFAPEALARMDSSIAEINSLLGSHSVFLSLVTSLQDANVVLDADPSTPLGGASDGVLGYFAEYDGRGHITLVEGWNWYLGDDPAAIGSSQFDFQTIVTHELGHALGLGHSDEASSVMKGDLSPGTARRAISEEDLCIPEEHDGDGEALYAGGFLQMESPEQKLAAPVAAVAPRITESVTHWFLAPSRDVEQPLMPSVEYHGPVHLISSRNSGVETLAEHGQVDESIISGEGLNPADGLTGAEDIIEIDSFGGIWVG